MEKSNSLVKATSQFAECVVLISASHDGKENVMPATWCVPVSHYPTMILVNISPERYTHDMVKKSKEFGANLLAEGQVGLSRFAGGCSGEDKEKLKMGEFEVFGGEKIRAPLIKGCVANLECKVVNEVKAGDHTIFVGQVLNFYHDELKRPLVLFRGGYHKLGPSMGGY
ncbi:MAG: flavin reductase [Candidatus Altiarchaeota archaeon]|nr:flavin reductase [Candidatus Altiarchaeota archaeon]